MLDIKFLRENTEAVKENIRKKFQNAKLPLVDEAVAIDAERRAAMQEASDLRALRNQLSKKVGMLMGQAKKDPSKLAEAEEAKAQVKANADRLAELEALEDELAKEIRKIMLVIPNIIDPSVPGRQLQRGGAALRRAQDPRLPHPLPHGDHGAVRRRGYGRRRPGQRPGVLLPDGRHRPAALRRHRLWP